MSTSEQEQRALLEAAREACAPTSRDRERMRAALFASIATGRASATALRVDQEMIARAPGPGVLGAQGMMSKVAAIVFAAAVVGWPLFSGLRGDEALTKPAASHAPRRPDAVPKVAGEPPSTVHASSTLMVASDLEAVPTITPEPVRASPRVRAAAHVRPTKVTMPVARDRESESSRDASVEAPHLGEELLLIRRASDGLRTRNFDAANAALLEHAQRFPHGELAAERRALNVLVRCGRAVTPEAVAARDAFLRSSPSSPLADRVRHACAQNSVSQPNVP